MKTMKRGADIQRFSDDTAERKKNEGWIFCQKKEYKDLVKGKKAK